MTRRKSVCLKWTLVLLVVLVCPSVYTRPQENSPIATTIGVQNKKSTQAPIRYRFSNLRFNSFKIAPKVISIVNNTNVDNNPKDLVLNFKSNNDTSIKSVSNSTRSRTSRLIRANAYVVKKKFKPKPIKNKSKEDSSSQEAKKPAIRKVLTKWRDKTKLDDLNYSYESTTSRENEKSSTKISNSRPNDDSSADNSKEINSKRHTRPPNNIHYINYNPNQHDPEESHVYSSNIHLIDMHTRPTRPPYFHTMMPTPTPIITNVGYPKPWNQITRKTTTPRPVHNNKPINYNYHNVQNFDGHNYEVSTLEPANSYTDRIVIRPQEYSPYDEDCPTIYLTLNNTFQGQGKEACPDLNIAVNTNVVNKNVVIESEEEGDSLFPGSFGLGIGDDSGADASKDEDYSEETLGQEEESASVEGTELASYHAANSVVQSESSEAGGYGAAASPSAALSTPGRPGSSDDDIFSFSSLVDFFRPALNALGWLATINPLSIGLFPLLLAPLGLLFAGSGFAALFAPWFFPYGREAPKVIHVFRPEWRWDEDLKTWQLHSFPNNRRIIPDLGRANKETNASSIKMELFSKLKDWMITLTNKLKENQSRYMEPKVRRSKRKRRDTWKKRLKIT